MSAAKRRLQQRRRAAFVATIVQPRELHEPIELSQRAADALADFILADAELRGDKSKT